MEANFQLILLRGRTNEDDRLIGKSATVENRIGIDALQNIVIRIILANRNIFIVSVKYVHPYWLRTAA